MSHIRQAIRRALTGARLPLLVALLALWPRPAAAHPLDLLLHDIRTQLRPDQIVLHIQLVAGPLVTTRLWDELDADRSGALDDGEIRAWCAAYLGRLEVSFDDRRAALAVYSIDEFPRGRQEFVGAAATRIGLVARADWGGPVDAGEHRLELRGAAYPEISQYNWGKTRGSEGIVVREASAADQFASSFPIKWPAGLAAGRGAGAAPAAEPAAGTPPGEADPPLLARLRQADLTFAMGLAALGAALLFGALHALQPGHGKTLVAAYLVGSRGTVRHAVLLGGIVTITHTASVLALGSLLLTLSAWIRPERIIPGLTLVSGLLVAGMGAKLLWDRIARPPAAHSHAGGLLHSHDGAAGHDHAPRGINRALVSLGVSGGLVPCPEALALLIVAATIGRLALGLAMIVAFSLGLALVLISLGVILVTAGRRLAGRFGRFAGLARWVPAGSAALVLLLGAALAFEGWLRMTVR